MHQTIGIILFAVLAAPVVLLMTQMSRIRRTPQMTALASCYGVLVLDEFLFMQLHQSYYFYHVLVSCTVVSVCAGLLSMMERPAGKDGSGRLWPYYLVLTAALTGIATRVYQAPQSMGAMAVTALLMVLVINGVVLIRNIDDNAIPYVSIAALWALRNAVAYQPWPWLNTILGGAQFGVLSLYVMGRARRANQGLVDERDLLVRERDMVVNMLYDISSSAQSITSVNFTLMRVLEAIIEAIQVEGAAVYTKDEKAGTGIRLRYAQSSGVFWTMQLHAEHGAGKTTFVASDLKREVYAVGEGLVGMVAESLESLELDRGADRLEMRNLGLNPHNIRNVLAVPLKVKDKLLGVLVVQNRQHKATFGESDTRLLNALAEQASIVINNARMFEELAKTDRIRQEMNIASDIQNQLLPKTVPVSEHLRVHPFIRPAKEVGGDYYDFIESGEGSFAIVIGDVSGKGLPAGMVMVIARTTLQIVARGQSDTKEVLTRFSREMYPRMRRGQFMTINLLVWDDAHRVLRYSGAGHEHILWHRADRGASERIRAGGVAVGLLEDPASYLSETKLEMGAGDVFVLYTDGITEARNAHEEMYTLNRLQESLDRYARLQDAEKISGAIMKDVLEFCGDAEQYDDMTLLVATVS